MRTKIYFLKNQALNEEILFHVVLNYSFSVASFQTRFSRRGSVVWENVILLFRFIFTRRIVPRFTGDTPCMYIVARSGYRRFFSLSNRLTSNTYPSVRLSSLFLSLFFEHSPVNRSVMDDIFSRATENRIGSTILHRRLDQKGINPLRSVLRHA